MPGGVIDYDSDFEYYEKKNQEAKSPAVKSEKLPRSLFSPVSPLFALGPVNPIYNQPRRKRKQKVKQYTVPSRQQPLDHIPYGLPLELACRSTSPTYQSNYSPLFFIEYPYNLTEITQLEKDEPTGKFAPITSPKL